MKKILATILTVITLISATSVQAFADTEHEHSTDCTHYITFEEQTSPPVMSSEEIEATEGVTSSVMALSCFHITLIDGEYHDLIKYVNCTTNHINCTVTFYMKYYCANCGANKRFEFFLERAANASEHI